MSITRSRHIAIRDDVPFDIWFDQHGYHEPLKDATNLCSARIAAIPALGQGLMYSVIESIKYAFATIFDNPEAHIYRKNQLSTQWRGAYLCATAIISPNTAKENAVKENFFAYWVNPPHMWDSITT